MSKTPNRDSLTPVASAPETWRPQENGTNENEKPLTKQSVEQVLLKRAAVFKRRLNDVKANPDDIDNLMEADNAYGLVISALNMAAGLVRRIQ